LNRKCGSTWACIVFSCATAAGASGLHRRPHFLFNTLASVDYLIETDPARASRMQKNLIQYLRAALPQMRQASRLGQEMAQCRSYLEILKVRMDDRLQFANHDAGRLVDGRLSADDAADAGGEFDQAWAGAEAEGGVLTLSADVVNGNLRVVVSDTASDSAPPAPAAAAWV